MTKGKGGGGHRKKDKMSIFVLASVVGIGTLMSTFAATWVAKLMGYLNEAVKMLNLGISVTGTGIVAALGAAKAYCFIFPKSSWAQKYRRFLSDKGLEPAWFILAGVLGVMVTLVLDPLSGGILGVGVLAFRCRTCGRPINRAFKTPADRLPYCDGAKGCKNKPLPRCAFCGALFKPERANNKTFQKCDLSSRGGVHRWTYDNIRSQKDGDRAAEIDTKGVI